MPGLSDHIDRQRGVRHATLPRMPSSKGPISASLLPDYIGVLINDLEENGEDFPYSYELYVGCRSARGQSAGSSAVSDVDPQ
jgi:hypothetical protein